MSDGAFFSFFFVALFSRNYNGAQLSVFSCLLCHGPMKRGIRWLAGPCGPSLMDYVKQMDLIGWMMNGWIWLKIVIRPIRIVDDMKPCGIR